MRYLNRESHDQPKKKEPDEDLDMLRDMSAI